MAASRPPFTNIRADVWLDARRALWLSGPGLLIVADIHWGYVTSHRARGNLLPPWGDDDIAARLSSLIEDYRPSEMIWLGDSLHTLAGRETAEQFIAGIGVTPVSVVAGNHDFRWKRAISKTLDRGSYLLHHGNLQLEVPSDRVEIIGHHHPAVRWHDGAGGNLKLPALVESPRRLILPAFSPWAAGTPWNSKTLQDENLWAVSPRRVFQIPRGRRPGSPGKG
jgi:putative SbcD/Mre11-related phosphoesterase